MALRASLAIPATSAAWRVCHGGRRGQDVETGSCAVKPSSLGLIYSESRASDRLDG